MQKPRETMYVASLRDIDNNYYHYIYTGFLPKKYVKAYNTIIDALGLDIEFQGTLTEEEPKKVFISQGMKVAYDFEIFGYRRMQVRERIKSLYKNYIISAEEIVEPKYIICSEPRVSLLELIEKEYLGDKVKFIYDRTDNWGALKEFAYKIDNLCSQYADLITCSAYGLIQEEYKEKTKYIPNGNKWYDLEPCEKHEKPTAIYVGNNIEKFNGLVFYRLACNYPDWNFIAYINCNAQEHESMMNHPPNVEFRMPIPQEELIKEIQKCHVGLLLFYNTEWESGMLPLKLFNYINASIPAFYTNGLRKNLQDYNEVAYCISDITLDELLEIKPDYLKYKRDWSVVLNELFNAWEIENET